MERVQGWRIEVGIDREVVGIYTVLDSELERPGPESRCKAYRPTSPSSSMASYAPSV